MERSSMHRSATAALFVALLAGTAHAGATQFTQINSGVLMWTDRAGNPHLMGGNSTTRGIKVEFWDDDTIGTEDEIDDLLGTARTNGATGRAGLGTSQDDFGDFLEVYMRIFTDFAGVGSVGSAFNNTYVARMPSGEDGVVPIAEFNGMVNSLGGGTFPTTTDTGRSMSILHAVDFMATYYRSVHGATTPDVKIRYDQDQSTDAISTSYNGTTNQLSIQNDDWADWDVLFHEYGHSLARNNDLDWRRANGSSVGGGHSAGVDNIRDGRMLGAVSGSRLAWAEGVATTLGMMAIQDGDLRTAIPGLPASDYDLTYQDINYAADLNTVDEAATPDLLDDSITYSIESKAHQFDQMNSGRTGQGEGDELSVQRILWDLYDDTPGEAYTGNNNASDMAKFGASRVYDLMENTTANTDDSNGTLRGFTERVNTSLADAATRMNVITGATAATTLNEARATVGDTYEEYGVSSNNLTNGMQNRLRPFLTWNEQNGDNSGNFKALIFDSDWVLVDESPLIADMNANTIDLFRWRPADALDPGDYNFVVLNSSAIDGANNPGGFENWYWSGTRVLNVIPTPNTAAIMVLGAIAGVKRRR